MSPRRYDSVAIGLHWVIGAGILLQIVMGLVMVQLPIAVGTKFWLYQMHKSVGVTLLFAACLRILWRLSHTPPDLPQTMPVLERRAATSVHGILYLLMLGLPLTGWALVSVSPYHIPTVLFGVVPWPHLPILASLPDKAVVEPVASFIHRSLAFILIGLLGLHIMAGLRHHFILRDGLLRRMLPSRGVS